MIERLTIQADGDLFIRGLVKDDTNQCVERGVRDFSYRVLLDGDAEKLSSQGFILDRHKIYKYFSQKWEVPKVIEKLPSCEEMCLIAAKDIAALAEGQCKKVTVSIQGATVVWVREGT